MTQQSAVPSPSVMPQFKKPVIADLAPDAEAKTYDVNDRHVVKAKHLKPGMEVQPFVHGQPRGSVRVVAEVPVKADDDGAEWYIQFATDHPAQNYKAAYRFWQLNLDDETEVEAEVVETVAPEPVKNVKKRERPAPPEHLTHNPFQGLADLLKEVQ